MSLRVLAGERSGSLGEVIERFIAYQKLSLSVRKKLLVSLLYPAVLVSLVDLPDRVPSHVTWCRISRELYASMDAQLPAPTQILIAIGTTARNYVLLGFAALVVGDLRVSILGADAKRAAS